MATLDAATTSAVNRVVIYHAGLTLVVPNVNQTVEAIQSLATEVGGYLQEIDGSAISIRVPASHFQAALTAIGQMGEITQRKISAQDITEEMHDLNIRLENAEQMRKELLDLIAKSTKVEDTLKIETELMRVTEQVELLKGKIKFMSQQAAFSTIRVDINSPLPQKQMVAQIPFEWVRELGNGVATGAAEISPDTSRWQARNVRYDLPTGYIRYFERDKVTEAMSAEGILIKLQEQENYDGGKLEFWTTLARKALVENRAIHIEKETALKLKTKADATVLIGTKEQSGKKVSYMVGLVATKKHVYTFEAWGSQDQFNKDLAALNQAFESLKVNP